MIKMNYNSFRKSIKVRFPRRRPGRMYRRVARIAKRTMLRSSEIKFSTVEYNAPGSAIAPVIIPFNNPFPQGTGKTQAIGKKIKFKNLNVNFGIGTFYTALSSTAQAWWSVCSLRVIIIQYRQVPSTVGSYFFALTTPYLAFQKVLPNMCRVLSDKLYTVSPTVGNDQIAMVRKDEAVPSGISCSMNFPIHNDVNLNVDTDYPTEPTDKYGMIVLLSRHQRSTTAIDDAPATFAVYGSATISFYDV